MFSLESLIICTCKGLLLSQFCNWQNLLHETYHVSFSVNLHSNLSCHYLYVIIIQLRDISYIFIIVYHNAMRMTFSTYTDFTTRSSFNTFNVAAFMPQYHSNKIISIFRYHNLFTEFQSENLISSLNSPISTLILF